MKKLSIVLLIAFICSNVFSQPVEKEKDKIKKTIQTAYVEGLQNEGDMDKIDSGFHPDFKLLGKDEGDDMWKLPIDDWKKRTLEKKEKGELPKKESDKVSVKFLSVDVSDDAAMVKLEFYVGKELRYIDYLSLYKFESGWKIVNKIFTKIE